jgi:hypothetical protein
LVREVAVARREPREIVSPVRGRWIWGNGPGETRLHTHFRAPEQRYAYDLLAVGPPGSGRGTSRGDRHDNRSFYAWDQPFYCVEDGKVIEVVDDVPDNLGVAKNPANPTQRNARIVVEHAGRRVSVYAHVRQGGAAVKVGARVKAGDVLGRVGNAGHSSEPHLHFGYLELDRSGRVRAVPVHVRGLKDQAGEPITGVPLGSGVYQSGPTE